MYTQKATKEIIQELRKNCWTPDENLSGVPYVEISKTEDLKSIPKTNGAYWIGTEEPVKHSMFKPDKKHPFPAKMNNGFEIIYNGVAGHLQGRAQAHLLRKDVAGMSGISLDLYMGDKPPASHIKAAFSSGKKKVPFIDGKRIKEMSDLQNILHFEEEKNWLNEQEAREEILFWNGINVLWEKHKQFKWRFYFYEGDKMMTDIIEDMWRKRYGKPRLCSYNDGR